MSEEALVPHVRETFQQELATIQDEGLRERVVRAWARAMALSGATDLARDYVSIAPLRQANKQGFGVEHVRAVVQLSLAIADMLTQQHSIVVDKDVLTAGALLHDVGKLLEHAPDERSELAGHLVGHATSGVVVSAEAGLPREVLHIIAYHAFEGQRHHRTVECEIVYRADMLSVDALVRRELGKTAGDFIHYVYLP